jgi:hypothetical protein
MEHKLSLQYIVRFRYQSTLQLQNAFELTLFSICSLITVARLPQAPQAHQAAMPQNLLPRRLLLMPLLDQKVLWARRARRALIHTVSG